MKHSWRLVACLGICAAAQPALCGSAIEIADLMSLANISDTQISPDGTHVAYVVASADLEENAYARDVWLVDSSGGAPRQMTRGTGRDDTPRWSPDGTTLAFVSDRTDGPALWLLPVDGGEARRLTLKTGIGVFAWSPDGNKIALTRPSDPGDDSAKGEEGSRPDVIVVDRDLRVMRLHLVDVATGEESILTDETYSVDDFSWSPDGRAIVFSSRPAPKVEELFNADIFTVDLESAKVTDLVVRPGADASPRWSPDGSRIAFVSNYAGQDWISNWHAYVVPAEGGEPRNVSHSFDGFTIFLNWSGDGKRLLFAAWKTVTTQIFDLAVESGTVRQLSSGLYSHGLRMSLSKDTSRMAFLRSDPQTPAEVFISPTDEYSPRRLTQTNPQLETFDLGETRVVHWQGRDGRPIDGLLILPPDADARQRLPLLTYVHGGPAGRFGAGFSPGLGESQPVQAESYPLHVLAGRGFAILLPNPRGSNGYGESFRKLNRADWGFGDYQDIMAGVDAMIDQGIGDPKRLGIMGRSYGGYMTAWIITQTDRFAIASLGAAMFDLRSFYGQTDIPGYLEYYLDGDPWSASEAYKRHSPISYANQIRTPTLIIQGEADHRVPLSQAKELYQALRRHDVEVEFIILPRQGHVTTEPRLQQYSLERNLQWFERWLVPNSAQDDERGKPSAAGGAVP